jgi:hypothetical protein
MGLIGERRWTSPRLDYLEKLDDLVARLADQADFFRMSDPSKPSTPSDDEMPDLMMTGFSSRITAARVLP